MLSSAAGLGFLGNTPLSYFTAQDKQLISDTVNLVLADSNPATAREWLTSTDSYSGKYPGKYSGKVEGLGAFKSTDGLQCRKIRISTQAKGIESAAVHPACRTASDDWQLASGRTLEKV
ncbi:MAG TPA: hypothetical protein VGN07_20595 [Steroidobacteraceae bacterium]